MIREHLHDMLVSTSQIVSQVRKGQGKGYREKRDGQKNKAKKKISNQRKVEVLM